MKIFKMAVTVRFDEVVEFKGGIKSMINRVPSLPRTEDGIPFIYDYMWKGYLKDIFRELQWLYLYCSCNSWKINHEIFIEDRVNPIILPEGLDYQVDREKIPAGSTCSFTVMTYDTGYFDLVKEWLCYKHPNTEFGDITEVEIHPRR